MRTTSAVLLLALMTAACGESPAAPTPPPSEPMVPACHVEHVPATTRLQIVYVNGVPIETLVVVPAHDQTVCS